MKRLKTKVKRGGGLLRDRWINVPAWAVGLVWYQTACIYVLRRFAHISCAFNAIRCIVVHLSDTTECTIGFCSETCFSCWCGRSWPWCWPWSCRIAEPGSGANRLAVGLRLVAFSSGVDLDDAVSHNLLASIWQVPRAATGSWKRGCWRCWCCRSFGWSCWHVKREGGHFSAVSHGKFAHAAGTKMMVMLVCRHVK